MSKQVNEAWALYCKGFAIEVDKVPNIASIEYAFKHAFMMGARSVGVEQPIPEKQLIIAGTDEKQIELSFDSEFKDAPYTERPRKRNTGIERKKGVIRRRSFAQRENEAQLVASILKRNGKATLLEDIFKAVNGAGCNWNPKSASGHMKDVMKHQPCVKRIGFGMFIYEQ